MIVENTTQVKALLKEKFVTLKNASEKLNIDYGYLTKTINGYEGYNSVTKALTKAGIPLIIQQTRKEAGIPKDVKKEGRARPERSRRVA